MCVWIDVQMKAPAHSYAASMPITRFGKNNNNRRKGEKKKKRTKENQ
jgi:hypothetical protein